jgi:uncharacterized lipoprotein YmbA
MLSFVFSKKMNNMFTRFVGPGFLLFGILIIMLTGCVAGGPSPPTRFYTLYALSESETPQQTVAGEKCFAIGIGPIQMPEYLNRPQIVTRLSRHELKLDEFSQWAEPLTDNFSTVLSENVGALLCADPIAIYPFRGNMALDFRVEVVVIRFDGVPDKEVTLITRWAIVGQERDRILLVKRSTYVEKTENNTYEALAIAKSRAVQRFSEDIAAEIKKLIEQ